MAGIKHAFTSAKTDSPDTTLVRPTNWNADHVITGDVEFSGFNIKTTGDTFTITLDDNNDGIGTLTALTLGGADPFGDFGHVFDAGSADAGSLTIKNSAATAFGPGFMLYQNSASPAASDQIGFVDFLGNDSTATLIEYFTIAADIVDPTHGSDDSDARFIVRSAGSSLTALTLGTTNPEDGTAYAHLFSLGGNDAARLAVKNTSAGANGPIFTIMQDSPSPAVSDFVGRIWWYGRDSANNTQKYAFMHALIFDATSGSEDSVLTLGLLTAGVEVSMLNLGNTSAEDFAYGATFDLGSGDFPTLSISNTSAGTGGPYFHTYANSASPAANDTIGGIIHYGKDSGGNAQEYSRIQTYITDATSGSEDGRVDISCYEAGSQLTMLSLVPGGSTVDLGSADFAFMYFRNESSGSGGPAFGFKQASASAAAGDFVGFLKYLGNDGAGNETSYAQISTTITDATNGSEDGKVLFNLMYGGTAYDILALGGTDVDGRFGAQFDLGATAFGTFQVKATDPGSSGIIWRSFHDSASPAAIDQLMIFGISGRNSAATKIDYVNLYGQILDPVNGTEDGLFKVETRVAGANASRQEIAAGIYHPSATGTDKGNNSTNFSNQYDDGTLLITCYVDEAARTGQVDLAYWDSMVEGCQAEGCSVVAPTVLGAPPSVHGPAHKFASRLGTEYDPTKLSCQRKHVQDKQHLTPYQNRENFSEATRPSLGSWIQRGVEMDELLFLYVCQLEDRLAALEATIH